MIIKCPECSHENQLGAIFCRNCGAKLEIDKMAPEVKDRSGPGVFKIIRRTIISLVVLVLIGLLAGVFIPRSAPAYGAFGEEEMKNLKKKCDELFKYVEGKGKRRTYVFTPKEATLAFNNYLLPEGKLGSLPVSAICFEQMQTGETRIIVSKKIGGLLPVRYEVTGTPTISESEEKGLELVPVKVGMGILPIPAALTGSIVSQFYSLTSAPELNQVIKAVDKFQIDDAGNYRFRLKKKK